VVTGGAGFIGSELVRQLAERGDREVVAIDNLVNGRRENLSGLAPRQVTLVEKDIRDLEGIAPYLREASIVYHLACLGVRHSVHSPVENHDVNATGTLRLLAAARSAGVARFVHVSSSEVYGTAKWVPMTEDHPTFPCTVYGGSKLAGECYARAFHRTYGYATVIVRPFNAYGPRSHHEGDSAEVIPKFILRSLAGKPMIVFGDGTQTRDFSYVSDTARGILLAGSSDAAVGRTINLGSGVEMSVNELAAAVAAVTGRAGRVIYDDPRPGDVLRLRADMSQARALLGYEPSVGFDEGLARMLEWYASLDESPEVLLRREVARNWDVNPAETGLL
jgi:UDP-glucose 4-epimerase